MKNKFFYLLAFFVTVVTIVGAKPMNEGDVNPSRIYEGTEITGEGAWCWFADPRALHYENTSGTINSSYIGYIDVHGNIKATQYDFLTGKRNEVLIRSYFQPDDHDNPTFLVLPDERVMVFYSRHTDEACFYYRISRNKGDITSLGEEKKIPTANNTTYPSPFILSDDPSHIYLCWRGINWHPTIAKLSIPDAEDNTKVTWGPYQMVQSTGARPYAKYLSNGKDKIYLTYTTGHPDNENPNFVYFNYVDINTLQLQDVKGKVLSTIANGPFQVNKTTGYVSTYPNTVVDNPSGQRDWVWQVAKDEAGNPAIAMVQISPDKTSHNYYYARWTGTEWKKTFLANAGGHFHQTPNLEMCYSAGMALDPEHPNEIYCSVPVVGISGKKVYEIVKYVVNEDDKVASTPVTENSLKNNIRPYILPGSKNSALRLVWMHGDYYDWIVSSSRPLGYPTAIHCDFALPDGPVDLEEGLLLWEDFNGTVEGNAQVKEGVLVTTSETSARLKVKSSPAFTVSLSPYIYGGTYEGTLLRIGNLSYSLDLTTLKPSVKVGEDVYQSTNILGTSDCWQREGRGTGGNWPTPEKHKFFNLTLSYADGVLTTYINGLIDQVLEVPNLAVEEVNIGGFRGWVEDCRIYDRVLNQSEIRQLAQKSVAYQLPDELIADIELETIQLPQYIVTDIVLPTSTPSGAAVTWTSGNNNVVSSTGLVTLPSVSTSVTLTAMMGGKSKTFQATVLPRDVEHNKVLVYTFEEADTYTRGGVTYVSDKSGNKRDAAIYGNARINGALDLTSNTLSGFSTNGYAVVPGKTLDSLRSYTFFMKVNPVRLDKQPRLYDFGSSSSNSVFGRASKLTAGLKYNGQATKMVDASGALPTGTDTYVAFVFDAKTATTKIYVNGVQTASGTAVTYEPRHLVAIGADLRNYIGRTQWWDSSVASDNADYCGKIDDFCLFNIALTEQEIKNLQQTVNSIPEVAAKGEAFSFYPGVMSLNGKVWIAYEFTSDEFSGLEVKVVDMQGKVIQKLFPTSNPVVISGISHSGLYVVQASNLQQKRWVGKLVVE